MYIARKSSYWVAEVEKEGTGYYKYRITNDHFEGRPSPYSSFGDRPATEKEIAHLQACIRVGKFLPYNDGMLTPNYEIY